MAKKDRVLGTDTYVTLEDGGSVCLPAGTKASEMSDEALKKITNESAWATSALEDDEEVVHDYEAMSQNELLRLAQERNLAPVSNRKSDLVDALEYADQADAGSTAQVDVVQ